MTFYGLVYLIWIQHKYRVCTYDGTPGRIRATIVALDKQYVLHILSVSL